MRLDVGAVPVFNCFSTLFDGRLRVEGLAAPRLAVRAGVFLAGMLDDDALDDEGPAFVAVRFVAAVPAGRFLRVGRADALVDAALLAEAGLALALAAARVLVFEAAFFDEDALLLAVRAAAMS